MATKKETGEENGFGFCIKEPFRGCNKGKYRKIVEKSEEIERRRGIF